MGKRDGYMLESMDIYVNIEGKGQILLGGVQNVNLNRADANKPYGEAGNFNKIGIASGGRTFTGSFEQIHLTDEGSALIRNEDKKENPYFNLVGRARTGQKVSAIGCKIKGMDWNAVLEDVSKLKYDFDFLKLLD